MVDLAMAVRRLKRRRWPEQGAKAWCEGILACHLHMMMHVSLLRTILEACALTKHWCCWTAIQNLKTMIDDQPVFSSIAGLLVTPFTETVDLSTVYDQIRSHLISSSHTWLTRCLTRYIGSSREHVLISMISRAYIVSIAKQLYNS